MSPRAKVRCVTSIMLPASYGLTACSGAISKATSHSRFRKESRQNITQLLRACGRNRRHKVTTNGILQNVSRIHIIIRGTVYWAIL